MTGLRTSSLSLAALVVVLAAPAATATTAPTTKQPAVPIERMALDAPRVAYAKEWHAQLAAGSLPTAVSSRYAGLSGGPLLRIGNTIYAGAVNRLATPTGPAVVVSAESGKPETVRTHVAGGSVRAAIADGAGGWYLGGTFSSVGGVARGGLAHVRADGTLDTAFDPPAGLGQVRALALDAGRLYVGGIRVLPAAPWFVPVLLALDPATGASLPVSYPPVGNVAGGPLGVIALTAGDGRLYAAFGGDNGFAAYDGASGMVLWTRAGATSGGRYGGPAALVFAGGKLLAGGQISTPAGDDALEQLDPVTGAVVGRPAVDGPVTGIATHGSTAYVLARSLWKLELSSGTLNRLAATKFGTAVATDGTTVYVAGRVAAGGDVRIFALSAAQTTRTLRPLSDALVGGGVNVLASQSGRLLVGGYFGGLGGLKRLGLAAFDARTGALLPWRPSVQGGTVYALAGSGRTIYLAGQFSRVSGARRDGVAAVSALSTGKLLPWHPRLAFARASAVAVGTGRVFVAGLLKPYGAKPRTPLSHLLAFSTRTGKLAAFRPRIGGVNTLAVWHAALLAGGSGGVTAFRLSGDGHVRWRQAIGGGPVPLVFTFAAKGSTLYVGGRFERIAGQPRTNVAALALQRAGALLPFAPGVSQPVFALVMTDEGLVFGTIGGPTFRETQALGVISFAGDLLPWEMRLPPSDVALSPRDYGGALNVLVDQIVAVPRGLVARGDFAWIGPPDNPAPGGLVWLRQEVMVR